ncbi:MAG: hypothetical protein PHE58_06505, partial [Candidatus Omnitrophica bacterium]|nr:hypothetical protein [Candidatus Omnitrophota bacterium]
MNKLPEDVRLRLEGRGKRVFINRLTGEIIVLFKDRIRKLDLLFEVQQVIEEMWIFAKSSEVNGLFSKTDFGSEYMKVLKCRYTTADSPWSICAMLDAVKYYRALVAMRYVYPDKFNSYNRWFKGLGELAGVPFLKEKTGWELTPYLRYEFLNRVYSEITGGDRDQARRFIDRMMITMIACGESDHDVWKTLREWKSKEHIVSGFNKDHDFLKLPQEKTDAGYPGSEFTHMSGVWVYPDGGKKTSRRVAVSPGQDLKNKFLNFFSTEISSADAEKILFTEPECVFNFGHTNTFQLTKTFQAEYTRKIKGIQSAYLLTMNQAIVTDFSFGKAVVSRMPFAPCSFMGIQGTSNENEIFIIIHSLPVLTSVSLRKIMGALNVRPEKFIFSFSKQMVWERPEQVRDVQTFLISEQNILPENILVFPQSEYYFPMNKSLRYMIADRDGVDIYEEYSGKGPEFKGWGQNGMNGNFSWPWEKKSDGGASLVFYQGMMAGVFIFLPLYYWLERSARRLQEKTAFDGNTFTEFTFDTRGKGYLFTGRKIMFQGGIIVGDALTAWALITVLSMIFPQSSIVGYTAVFITGAAEACTGCAFGAVASGWWDFTGLRTVGWNLFAPFLSTASLAKFIDAIEDTNDNLFERVISLSGGLTFGIIGLTLELAWDALFLRKKLIETKISLLHELYAHRTEKTFWAGIPLYFSQYATALAYYGRGSHQAMLIERAALDAVIQDDYADRKDDLPGQNLFLMPPREAQKNIRAVYSGTDRCVYPEQCAFCLLYAGADPAKRYAHLNKYIARTNSDGGLIFTLPWGLRYAIARNTHTGGIWVKSDWSWDEFITMMLLQSDPYVRDIIKKVRDEYSYLLDIDGIFERKYDRKIEMFLNHDVSMEQILAFEPVKRNQELTVLSLQSLAYYQSCIGSFTRGAYAVLFIKILFTSYVKQSVSMNSAFIIGLDFIRNLSKQAFVGACVHEIEHNNPRNNPLQVSSGLSVLSKVLNFMTGSFMRGVLLVLILRMGYVWYFLGFIIFCYAAQFLLRVHANRKFMMQEFIADTSCHSVLQSLGWNSAIEELKTKLLYEQSAKNFREYFLSRDSHVLARGQLYFILNNLSRGETFDWPRLRCAIDSARPYIRYGPKYFIEAAIAAYRSGYPELSISIPVHKFDLLAYQQLVPDNRIKEIIQSYKGGENTSARIKKEDGGNRAHSSLFLGLRENQNSGDNLNSKEPRAKSQDLFFSFKGLVDGGNYLVRIVEKIVSYDIPSFPLVLKKNPTRIVFHRGGGREKGYPDNT